MLHPVIEIARTILTGEGVRRRTGRRWLPGLLVIQELEWLQRYV
jgi:hypothetical protein